MKKFIFAVILLFTLFVVSNLQASEKKMAVSGGFGTMLPLGDTGDMVDFPMIPLLLSFQYALQPYLTLEGDTYYHLYSSPAEDVINDVTIFQIGISARYWLTTKWRPGETYSGIYAGGGLAVTNVEVEMETTYYAGTTPIKTTSTTDDNDLTLVVKGGYIFPLDVILLDVGARYDAVDFEFADAVLGVYCMASYLF